MVWRPSRAIVVAAALVVVVIVGFVAWTAGWLGVNPPKARSVNPLVAVRVSATRPIFTGEVPVGSKQAELAILPGVSARWTVQINPDDGTFKTAAPVQVPPGQYSLYVDGKLFTTFQAPPPQSPDWRPIFSGHLPPGATQAQFELKPPVMIHWTVPVDAKTGQFKTESPVPLDPGTYRYFVNDAVRGAFVVTNGAK